MVSQNPQGSFLQIRRCSESMNVSVQVALCLHRVAVHDDMVGLELSPKNITFQSRLTLLSCFPYGFSPSARVVLGSLDCADVYLYVGHLCFSIPLLLISGVIPY